MRLAKLRCVDGYPINTIVIELYNNNKRKSFENRCPYYCAKLHVALNYTIYFNPFKNTNNY